MGEKTRRSSWLKKCLESKVARIIIIVVVVVATVGVGVTRYVDTQNKTTKLGFEDIGELATQSAYCTVVHTTDASRKLWGIKIPFTQSKYIYSYDVVLKAGFDFKDITWKEKKDKIIVKFPEAKILSCEIDVESFEVYHEKESVFRQISLEENNKALKELKKLAEKDAVENGLLKEARKNAEVLLKGFFKKKQDQGYEIQFEDK